MLVSIIVPAFNAGATLPACVEALQRQELCRDDADVDVDVYVNVNVNVYAEIIIVDDGSTDDTATIAVVAAAGGGRYPVTVLRQPHGGPAAARNLGAQHARGELLLFTNADCAPRPDWAACMCRPFNDPLVAGAKGVYHTGQRSRVARFVQQEYESKYRRMARQRAIDFVDAYSAAYRRQVFLDNGGFDTAFTVPSVEDQEFSFRLARKGYRLVFTPEAGVDHRHESSISGYLRRKYGIGYWKAFLLRWLPEKAFDDSHTPPSQRWQIGLLGLAVLGALAAPLVGPGALAASGLGLILLFATAAPFLVEIARRDRGALAIAPVLLLGRTAALGAGLLAGFIAPPRRHSRPTTGLSLFTRPIKRAIDIACAVAGLAVSLPVILAVAVAIKLESPGPAVFVQERAGEGGQPFRIYKLRTMIDGADDQLPALLGANSVRGPTFKILDDPRVTRVGRVLRRWSIDELPQLWNVLRGEMSLVGPRPEPLRYVAQYDESQRRRLVVKPGMTGPAQVAGRGRLDFDDRLALELDYIEHYSLRKDLVILWRTIGAVLSGQGAY